KFHYGQKLSLSPICLFFVPVFPPPAGRDPPRVARSSTRRRSPSCRPPAQTPAETASLRCRDAGIHARRHRSACRELSVRCPRPSLPDPLPQTLQQPE